MYVEHAETVAAEAKKREYEKMVSFILVCCCVVALVACVFDFVRGRNRRQYRPIMMRQELEIAYASHSSCCRSFRLSTALEIDPGRNIEKFR